MPIRVVCSRIRHTTDACLLRALTIGVQRSHPRIATCRRQQGIFCADWTRVSYSRIALEGPAWPGRRRNGCNVRNFTRLRRVCEIGRL